MDCDRLDSLFHTGKGGILKDDKDYLEVRRFVMKYDKNETTIQNAGAGFYQCFC
jgi:hypothetical protein